MTSALSAVNYIVVSPADWGITDALASVMGRWVHLTIVERGEQLVADGFTDADLAWLDSLISSRLTPDDSARLARLLRDAQSLDDEGEVAAIAQEWTPPRFWETLGRQIYDAGFPNSGDALCYVACEFSCVFSNAVAMESLRRQLASEPAVNWEMDPADVALGKAIADEGLMEEAKTWPIY